MSKKLKIRTMKVWEKSKLKFVPLNYGQGKQLLDDNDNNNNMSSSLHIFC